MLSPLIPDLLSATEDAAIAAHVFYAKNCSDASDNAAVNAMRSRLNSMLITGRIVAGEGERDKAPMLHVDEIVGKQKSTFQNTSSLENISNIPNNIVDFAVDPLECTDALSKGVDGSTSLLVASKKNGLLRVPDIYMDKIAIGFQCSEQIISLDNSIKENLLNIALIKSISISELKIIVLDRPRNIELIEKIRSLGARVKLIKDGDVAAVLSTSKIFGDYDAYFGIGGSPEGIIAAAALKTLGGQFCARLCPYSDEEKARTKKMGIEDISREYFLHDIVSDDAIFISTAVTNCLSLKGIKYNKETNTAICESFVISSEKKQVQKIQNHRFLHKNRNW